MGIQYVYGPEKSDVNCLMLDKDISVLVNTVYDAILDGHVT